LPRHTLLGPDRIPAAARARCSGLPRPSWLRRLWRRMSVFPILEMVTEKYLAARRGRVDRAAPGPLVHARRNSRASSPPGEVLRARTARSPSNFFGRCRQSSVGEPTLYNRSASSSERRPRSAKGKENFLGFLDARRECSGGGMGFSSCSRAPARGPGTPAGNHAHGQARTGDRPAVRMESGPSTISPSTERNGSVPRLLSGADAPVFRAGYYQQSVPRCLRHGGAQLTRARNAPTCSNSPGPARREPEFAPPCWPTLLRPGCCRRPPPHRRQPPPTRCSTRNGFDRVQHEQIRADLRAGRDRSRDEPASRPTTKIEDVAADALFDASTASDEIPPAGRGGLAGRPRLPFVTYAAGVGSRLDAGGPGW